MPSCLCCKTGQSCQSVRAGLAACARWLVCQARCGQADQAGCPGCSGRQAAREGAGSKRSQAVLAVGCSQGCSDSWAAVHPGCPAQAVQAASLEGSKHAVCPEVPPLSQAGAALPQRLPVLIGVPGHLTGQRCAGVLAGGTVLHCCNYSFTATLRSVLPHCNASLLMLLYCFTATLLSVITDAQRFTAMLLCFTAAMSCLRSEKCTAFSN